MSEWIKWELGYDKENLQDNSWLINLRIKIFKAILSTSIFFLTVIIIRAHILNEVAIADIGNAIIFSLILALVSWKPQFFTALKWLGLLALSINTFDGLRFFNNEIVNPSYILYPLLILYGALLGDIWITLTALLGVSGIYGYIWVVNSPLNRYDLLIMTNLSCVVLGSGVSAMAVWFQHHKILTILKNQSHELSIELDNKLRLNALIFHDIINPLSVIDGISALMKSSDQSQENRENIEIIESMSKRIISIIHSARGMEAGFNIDFEKILVTALYGELKLLFSEKLKKKELQFISEIPDDLYIRANSQLLCNSVFGNFISNAIKYSKRCGEIKMKAEVIEGGKVRISITDHGAGFPEELLNHLKNRVAYNSTDGTEGEKGNAYGMMIASLCLKKLNATLEVKNCPEGGACVSAVFKQI
jgi:signal transduction histidine kinase